MVYGRVATIALTLLLAGCPGEDNAGNDTGAASGGQTSGPSSAGGSEGPCPGGGSLCGAECVFLGSDNNNCGGCGVVCGQGEECISAECLDLDPCDTGPGEPCGSVCVQDLDNNNQHCGECGNDCGEGENCQGGMCVGGAEGPSDTGSDTTTGEPPPGTTSGEPPGTTSGEPPGTTSGGSSTG